MSSVTPTFPPRVTLASALNSTNASVLAAQAFADPNAGYAGGLQLWSSLDDNHSGHFSLASGLTAAANSVNQALSTIKDIQSSITDLYATAATLRDPATTDGLKDAARAKLTGQLKDLRDRLQEANVEEFNLLDATKSDGVKLDLASGAFTNLGKTPDPNGSGNDQRFAYAPGKISFQTTDIAKAIDDLSNLEVETFDGTDDNLNTSNSISTVARFQTTLDQAAKSLQGFRDNLAEVAASELNVTSDATNSDSARQIAAQLAKSLHNDSFNVAASATARFFSLFA